jgi:DNA repair exonuclease SbcCD ATPase subunit
MKKFIILTLCVCCYSVAFSQDLVKEIQKLTLVNDSLQKQVIKPLRDNIQSLNAARAAEASEVQALKKENDGLSEQIKNLNKDIADLNKNKLKIEKDALQKQVDRLTANVAGLEQRISEKEKQIGEEKRNGEQTAKQEKENGKNEILANIADSYKNKKFDDLVNSSTEWSVQRDILLVGNNAEVKTVLSDLVKYFNAKESLAQKFDAAKIKDAQAKLSQIQRQSELLDKLKENVGNYQTFNDGLKESIEKINNLDKRESVSGMDKEIQRQKFNKILAELSSYIFNYDFNFMDYPYLSDIVLEIIKRKQPNPDAKITDVLQIL